MYNQPSVQWCVEQYPKLGEFKFFLTDVGWIGLVLLIIAIIVAWATVGYPRWNVWASHQSGLADLQQAKNEQQVQVAAAQGRLDAAEINKKAAIIEAEAVALQIKSIGQELTQHDLYLKWQWIKMMEERNAKSDTIYVPTEAGLPILEANRKPIRDY